MLEGDMSHFPEKYGENYLYILEVDPFHLHIFWEITQDMHQIDRPADMSEECSLYLKVMCDFHQGISQGGCCTLNIPVKGMINDWFIELQEAPVRCHAELGLYDHTEDLFTPLCSSNFLQLAPEEGLAVFEEEKEISEAKGGLDGQESADISENIQRERHLDLMKNVTNKDIEEYYFTLPERLVSCPESLTGIPPWKAILESMSLEEAKKALETFPFPQRISEPHSSPETISSDRSERSS